MLVVARNAESAVLMDSEKQVFKLVVVKCFLASNASDSNNFLGQYFHFCQISSDSLESPGNLTNNYALWLDLLVIDFSFLFLIIITKSKPRFRQLGLVVFQLTIKIGAIVATKCWGAICSSCSYQYFDEGLAERSITVRTLTLLNCHEVFDFRKPSA